MAEEESKPLLHSSSNNNNSSNSSSSSRSTLLWGEGGLECDFTPWLDSFYLLVMCSMGCVTGLTAVSLSDLATNCGVSTLSAGIVFLCQGVGALIGGGLSLYLFPRIFHHVLLMYCGLCLAAVFLYVGSVASLSVLCCLFFIIGCLHCVIQIGCISLIRDSRCSVFMRNGDGRYQNNTIGGLLGLSQLAFSVGAFIFTAIYTFSSLSIEAEYYLLCSLVVLVFTLIVAFSNPEDARPKPPSISVNRVRYYNTEPVHEENFKLDVSPNGEVIKTEQRPAHFYSEIFVGLASFLLYGMSILVSAYLSTYADKTGSESIFIAHCQIAAFWAACSLGCLCGSVDQFKLKSEESIPPRISALIICSCVFALTWIANPYDVDIIWISIVFVGLLCGPTTAYGLDLLHRTTYPTDTSTIVCLIIINSLGMFSVYIWSAIWNYGGEPLIMLYAIIVASLLSVPFIWFSPNVSYIELQQIVSTKIWDGTVT